ncbi:uncharacterized protein LOC141674407 [Apium graveolens]|uniref:uncharacterized protein LOC141674407 n=1 Tax=Apium graveolens TaxID=4045 RepID=UPI003D79AD71
MTINKSQGQSLDTVGLYLPRAVFSHSHVYVAISRVTRPEGLHILIDSDDDMQDHHHLSNLDGNHTAWTLKIRVTRMWVSTNRQGVLVRHNLILLDCENNHILAIVPPALWNLFAFIINPGTLLRIRNVHVLPAAGFLRHNGFKTPVIEGGVYVFDQFFVKDVVGNLKPVQADICIRFAQYTTITAVEDDGMITTCKFKFLDLYDLFAKASKYQPQQQPEFAIDTVQIGTLPSSKLYLNLDDESVTDMRMRLKEEEYLSNKEIYLKAAKSEFVQTFMERMTLKDLNEKLTYDDLKKRIYTTFSVVKVDEDVAWWFYSCNKCQQEVERLDRRFRCNNCPRIIPVAPKRFRIMVLPEDDIFSCNVMLMDRAARRFVGTSAAKMYNDFEKAPKEGLPQVLKDLVGKEVTVIIRLKKANVTEDSTIFDANDIFDTTMWSPSPSESAHISESSSINFSVNSVDLDVIDHTPGSAKSVTKKIKKER